MLSERERHIDGTRAHDFGRPIGFTDLRQAHFFHYMLHLDGVLHHVLLDEFHSDESSPRVLDGLASPSFISFTSVEQRGSIGSSQLLQERVAVK